MAVLAPLRDQAQVALRAPPCPRPEILGQDSLPKIGGPANRHKIRVTSVTPRARRGLTIGPAVQGSYRPKSGEARRLGRAILPVAEPRRELALLRVGVEVADRRDDRVRRDEERAAVGEHVRA